MSIFTGTIRARVMKSINAKIEEAEKDYKDECLAIDEEAKVKKENALENGVKRLLAKVL